MAPRVLAEAWWGGDRAAGARPHRPHLVEWVAGAGEGKALCGAYLASAAMYPLGSAASARVKRCTECDRRLARRVPSAPVVPIGVATAHRRHAGGRYGSGRGDRP